MWINNRDKLNVDCDFWSILEYIENKEATLLNTSDSNIKVWVFWKKDSFILALVEEDYLKTIDYSRYTLRDMLDNTLSIKWKKYRPIAVLAKSDFVDWDFMSHEHLWMETLEEFRGLWIMNEMFKVKELVDWILDKSVEKVVSNIYMLLKNWYKVVWKINKDTWKEEPFNWQKFIEKIVDIKMKKWKIEEHLDCSYVFKK